MAAPLTFLLIVAVTIRAVLFRSSLAEIISERVEVVSPLNAWKRGLFVYISVWGGCIPGDLFLHGRLIAELSKKTCFDLKILTAHHVSMLYF